MFTMGAKTSRSDFFWAYDDEPHASRRKEILKKYPQMKQLFGNDSNMVWKVLGIVVFQFFCFYQLRDAPLWLLCLMGYCVNGVLNHSLTLAIHEIAHNLAFGHAYPLANRILGMVANSPIGVPISISFKKYHLLHHRYQGDDVLDTDIPSAIEGRLFNSSFGKFIWLSLQPCFYAFRPLAVCPQPVTPMEVVSVIVQLFVDAIVYKFLGLRVLLYMMVSSFAVMGLHPVAGHFISEHYMFKKGFETYSYYGGLNFLTFNVGYHNEHHDFPYIPGCRLPEVRKIAPEFYDTLPHHNSWSGVLYDFVMDPEIGPYARIKRKTVTDKLSQSQVQSQIVEKPKDE